MELNFNAEGWTQDQKNQTQAALVAILYERGITYASIHCTNERCEIDEPSEDFIVTEQNILDKQELLASLLVEDEDV